MFRSIYSRMTLGLNGFRATAFCASLILVMIAAVPPVFEGRAHARSADTADEESIAVKERRYEPPRLEKAIDPDLYILGPYDQLLINIVGPEPRSFSPLVLPEGNIFIPGVGAVEADGLTLNEFRGRLIRKLGDYYHDIEVFCFLQAPRVFKVFVTGEVANPGAVEVSAVDRVSDAIEFAGGTIGAASTRRIRLNRDGELVRVDLLEFHHKGILEYNPVLRSGDRIHVPVIGWSATIHGQVMKPGKYEIIEGETVEDLLEIAGGFSAEAVTDSVLVGRVRNNDIISNMVVHRDMYGLKIQDLDEVNVFGAFEGSNRVFVFGAVTKSGRFFIAPDEGLSELIVRTGRFATYADLENAFIEREGGEPIRVNLKNYLPPGPEIDFPLEDGDVLNVPSLYQKVTVGGEVNVPGEFPFQSNWTVAKYVGLAGGPTSEGSVNRVLIYSPDGDVMKADGGYIPKRGDTIIVKKGKARLAAEFFNGLIRLGTLVVTLIVVSR